MLSKIQQINGSTAKKLVNPSLGSTGTIIFLQEAFMMNASKRLNKIICIKGDEKNQKLEDVPHSDQHLSTKAKNGPKYVGRQSLYLNRNLARKSTMNTDKSAYIF